MAAYLGLKEVWRNKGRFFLFSLVIALIAINAARAERIEHIIVIGHLTDMASVRDALALVSNYYDVPIGLPADAGYATALGALLYSASRPVG